MIENNLVVRKQITKQRGVDTDEMNFDNLVVQSIVSLY